MKLCIFGPKSSPESELMKAAALEMGIESKRMKLSDIYLETENGKFNVQHRKFDLMDYDVFIFRPLNKQLWKGLVIAETLKLKGKTIIDECLTKDRWTNHIIPLKLSQNNISYFSQYTANGIKTSRDILMEIDHPIVIRMEFDDGKKQTVFSDDWTESYDLIRTSRPRNASFRRIPDTDSYYQLFVVGDRVLGGWKKTSLDKEFTLNYSDNLEIEEMDSINQEMAELAIRVCNVLDIDVASIDFIEDDGKLYILDVDRAPKFSRFQRKTGINMAKSIVEFATQKADRR